MGSFNEDFNHLMGDFSKAGLGNSSLPTFAQGNDYSLETVTEVLLLRIENAVNTCHNPEKKKALQEVAAKATIPYLTQSGKNITPDMKKKLSSIYGTDNMVFVPADEKYQASLTAPKSDWNNDFGCLREEYAKLVWHDFPNPGKGDYDLDAQCRLLLARLQDGKHGMRDAEKIDQINALTVKAAELYLQKSGKSAAEMPDEIKKAVVDILGKDAKIVSNTPDKKMKFDLSACITKEPEAPKKEKKPSLWSRIKNGAAKIWAKPAVKAVAYTALAVGFGAATAGLITASAGMAGGAYAAASVGNMMMLGMAVTTAGCLASLYGAGYKIKQAIEERRERRLKEANFKAKREKVILSFRDKVEQMQKDGNIASSVFEITKLDEQLKPLTVEENKERGQKNKSSTGLRTGEFDWVKNFYPKEFHAALANTLKLSRMGAQESEIKTKTAQAMEKAKNDYAQRKENEKNKKPHGRTSNVMEGTRGIHEFIHRERRKQSGLG